MGTGTGGRLPYNYTRPSALLAVTGRGLQAVLTVVMGAGGGLRGPIGCVIGRGLGVLLAVVLGRGLEAILTVVLGRGLEVLLAVSEGRA